MPDVLTLRAQARDEATPTLHTLVAATLRVGALGCCLLAAACEPEATGNNTSWSVTFACVAQAAQSQSVQVTISPGTCASPAAPVYRAAIQRGDAGGTAAPPDLAAGTYAFDATAYDSSGNATTTTCRDVVLPREQVVGLVLPGPQGCEPPTPPDEAERGEHPPGARPLDDASYGADAAIPPTDDGVPVKVPDGPDAAIASPDGGVPSKDASVPIPDASAPPDPEPDPDGGPCGGPCQVATYSAPTKDISLPKQCWAPGEFMPVTIHIPVTAKDWLWVKNHPDYGGSDREFWDHTGITTAGAVYRGGAREPGGLHAPSTTGSFSITWHPNDASDKEVRSTLGFTVSNRCP